MPRFATICGGANYYSKFISFKRCKKVVKAMFM